jgi:hypothetical protein
VTTAGVQSVHDELCIAKECTCEPDHYGHMFDCPEYFCICDRLTAAHERGYKEAEKIYTNSCMSCGYAGEWSTWICDDCLKEDEEDND